MTKEKPDYGIRRVYRVVDHYREVPGSINSAANLVRDAREAEIGIRDSGVGRSPFPGAKALVSRFMPCLTSGLSDLDFYPATIMVQVCSHDRYFVGGAPPKTNHDSAGCQVVDGPRGPSYLIPVLVTRTASRTDRRERKALASALRDVADLLDSKR